jgi:hypothetical protein
VQILDGGFGLFHRPELKISGVDRAEININAPPNDVNCRIVFQKCLEESKFKEQNPESAGHTLTTSFPIPEYDPSDCLLESPS